MSKRKGFWGKFDDLMDSLPGYIEGQTEEAKKNNDYTGAVKTSSYSSSTIHQGGKKIKVQTKNGKPEYISSFGKPVFNVTHLHVKKLDDGYDKYEVQINDQYFQMTEKQIEAIESILRLPTGVGVSMG